MFVTHFDVNAVVILLYSIEMAPVNVMLHIVGIRWHTYTLESFA